MPGRHPAHDTLADLAAEVLPDDEARVIEAHVIGCSRCAQLLADAEGMRRLLRSSDPGPMPTEVWHRLSGALAAEAATWRGLVQQAATGQLPVHPASEPASEQTFDPTFDPTTQPTSQPTSEPTSEPAGPHTDPWLTQEWPASAGWVPEPAASQHDPAGRPGDAPTGQWQRFVEEEARPETEPGPPSRSHPIDLGDARLEPAGEHPARPTSGPKIRRGSSLRTRRDVRTEGRAHAVVRWAKPLAIAAGVLALAGAGGLAVIKLPLGGESSTTSAGSAASAGNEAEMAKGAFASVVLSTGTNYSQADVAARALALVPGEPPVTDAQAGVGVAGAGSAPAPAAAPSMSGTLQVPLESRRVAASPGVTSGNASLADPRRLAACLEELDAGGLQPLVVDLARYDGKQAAIIVVASPDGGREVWAVSRDCGNGQAGQLAYVAVPPAR